MRISDWSSDVCSSDLVARIVLKAVIARTMPEPANDVLEIPLHGRIAAGVPIEAIEGQSSLSVPAALLGSGDHYALEVAGDSMVAAGKIGRASCRERVCQYVLI